MGRLKSIFCFIFLNFLLFACKDKKQVKNNYSNAPFLHQIKGTKNYEVITLDSMGTKVLWDSIRQNYLINTYNKYYKYSSKGDFIDSINSEFVPILDEKYSFPDEVNFYTTWLDDGKKERILYKNLIPYEKPEFRDSIEYLRKHLEYYNKSSFIKYSNFGYYYYYYYYNKKWYRLRGGGLSNIKKQYPEKLPPPRLKDIQIKQNPPVFVRQFYAPLNKNATNSSAIGASSDYTTGVWIVRVGLPGGDSLKYKRLGDGLGNLTEFYQLPKSLGGNDSILFISQQYHNSKLTDGGTYFTHGGLFMIRPRKKK